VTLPTAFTPEQREERVRLILAFPPTATHLHIAEQTGISRETVRRVRVGQMWAKVAPELERMEPDQSSRQCRWCIHWEPRAAAGRGCCGLGIPEPQTDGQTYARGCGAFTRG
jgi:hypothetical protein